MNVLLIRPPAISFKKKPSVIICEPLGLLYLASYLNKYGQDLNVGIIDGFAGISEFREGDFYGAGLSYREISKRIEDFSPDIIGLNYTFIQYSKGVHDISRIIKEISRDILVVCGGITASVFYQEVLEDQNIDLVVRGEGEETFLEIVRRFKNGLSLEDINGTIVKINGKIKVNQPRAFIKDLDEIPFPARELLDMKPYYNDPYAIKHSMRHPRLSIITSRGCPFRCVFCTIHSVWQHTYRARSPRNVVGEIAFLYKNYGIREVVFYDDNLTLDKKIINEICDEILRQKLKVKWSMPNGVAIWTLDKPTIKKMKRAGCYKMTFGLETGSFNTLKFMGKDFIDFDKAKELIKYCNKLGLWTISTFIIGFPYETKYDIDKTLRYSIDCGVDMATFFCATPYPGTGLFEIYQKEGLFTDLGQNNRIEWIADVGEPKWNTKFLTKEEIKFFILDLKRKFLRKRFISFLNPLRLLRKIIGFDEFRYFIKQANNYLPTLRSIFR